MSTISFSDDCAGCQPAMMDVKTGKVLSDDSPEMKAVHQMWRVTTRAERQAWHRFTCLNSRVPSDLATVKHLSDRFERALNELIKTKL